MADVPANWSTPDAPATPLASAALKNLANAACALSAEIDNIGGSQYADWELLVRGASAFAAGSYVSIWLLKCFDGTNYEDGAVAGPVIPARPADLIFPLLAVATQQRIAIGPRTLPNGKFKVFLQNSSGQAFTNTDNENVLRYKTYNDVIAQ